MATSAGPKERAGDVAGYADPREAPSDGETDRHSRVEVAAGDVAEGIDHDPECAAEGDRSSEGVEFADGHGSAADEDEREGADELARCGLSCRREPAGARVGWRIRRMRPAALQSPYLSRERLEGSPASITIVGSR